jgi:hypothetical protein
MIGLKARFVAEAREARFSPSTARACNGIERCVYRAALAVDTKRAQHRQGDLVLCRRAVTELYGVSAARRQRHLPGDTGLAFW